MDKTSSKKYPENKRLNISRGKEIDFSDCAELTPEMFAKVIIRKGLKPVTGKKSQLTLRIDSDVLEWFKS
jgi:uncharacterized protein (DUF4415 family)